MSVNANKVVENLALNANLTTSSKFQMCTQSASLENQKVESHTESWFLIHLRPRSILHWTSFHSSHCNILQCFDRQRSPDQHLKCS